MLVRRLALSLVLAASVSLPALAQTAKAYPDNRGGEVRLPMGDMAFADEVVAFTPGTPTPPPDHAIAQKAVSVADFKSGVDDNYVTLGCGGVLTVKFTDNALMDVEGPDLVVFETGPDVETADVFISKDGETWTEVGRIEGKTTALDIKGKVSPRDHYNFVRVTDRKSACTPEKNGADIDAIAAIGGAHRTSFDAAVLFDLGKDQLKPGAALALQDLADDLKKEPKARVVIEGHTDNSGTDGFNVDLSRKRAAAVGDFLVKAGVPATAIDTVGYGELQPVAPNDTAENMAKNRRVEALVIVGG